MKTVINYSELVCANQHTSKDTKPQTPAETSVLALSLISAATNVVYLITTVVSLLAD